MDILSNLSVEEHLQHMLEDLRDIGLAHSDSKGKLHYGHGTPHEPDGTPHSGRWEYGSGKNPNQHITDFRSRYEYLKKQPGMTEAKIAESLKMPVRELRKMVSNTGSELKAQKQSELLRLINEGMNLSDAAKQLDIPWSTAKRMTSADYNKKHRITNSTADELEKQVAAKTYLDISAGTAQRLNISDTKLDNAVKLLTEERGYSKYQIPMKTVSGKDTKTTVLVKSDISEDEVKEHKREIRPVSDGYSLDEGLTYQHPDPPVAINSNRIEVNYTEDGHGGVDKDGVIEIRRGVPDLDLGKANYAQVRIAVARDSDDPTAGTHYMKGVAVYSDDLPEGVDVRYNTNKGRDVPLFDKATPLGETVFKKMKDDEDMPFGTYTLPEDALLMCSKYYTDADGNQKQSAINVVNEEGKWATWGKTLASQFLSKQDPALAQRQLRYSYNDRYDEFKETMGLTNPTLRNFLLMKLADETESAAVEMRGKAMPGMGTYLLLPGNTLGKNEVYAPQFKDGTMLALIRFPHAGPTEILNLKVNNRNQECINMIGANAPDAICINHANAGKLSGADHDGDTVIAIPNSKNEIYSRPDEEMSDSLRRVREFDPQSSYPPYEGMKVIDKSFQQTLMGVTTNLIQDMVTLGKYNDDDLANVIKFSMVVIDSEKHKLNYKQAYKDFRIDELKRKYQGINPKTGRLNGAMTLLTKGPGEIDRPDRKEGKLVIDPETGRKHRLLFDPETGEKYFEETGAQKSVFNKKTGEWEYVDKTIKVPRLALKDDAYTLTSGGSKENPGTVIEAVYAEYSNALKTLARQARLETLRVTDVPYSPSAYAVYKDAVLSLKEKIRQAKASAPLERLANNLAWSRVQAMCRENPSLYADKDAYKKLKDRSLRLARNALKSKKPEFEISDREWEAIQHGACSKSLLKETFKYTDLDKLKQRAMPRQWKTLSPAKLAHARQYLDHGYTMPQVAEMYDISPSTLQKLLAA